GRDRGPRRRGREPAGTTRRRAPGQRRLRQYRGAGQGVRGARGRLPGGCRATFFNYRRKLGGRSRIS
ncbi:MAG: hypothetical protein ACXVCF_19290, partial [Isosphaeraceae bacterium]